MSAFRSPMLCTMACIFAIAPSAVVGERRETVDIFALRDKEELVLTVGDRLASTAANRCQRQAPGLGLTLHDLDQYAAPYRAAAATMFPRADLTAVLAVAAEGAAARAGVHAGDAVVAIDGRPVAPPASDGLGRVESVIAQAEATATTGSVRLTLTSGGAERKVTLEARPACAVRFQVRPERTLDARTNGWLIEMTTGLVDFTANADELAAVLAHELAHVILEHRERTRGAQAEDSRVFELEADRLAVRLADDAGFRAGAAADFWRRMRMRGGGPSGLGRHPADRQRIAAVKQALDELAVERTPSPE